MQKQIATIGFKIASIYLLLSSVSVALSSFGTISLSPSNLRVVASIGFLVGVLVVLWISTLMWLNADVLPERLLGIKGQYLDNRQIATLSIKIIGLYVALRAIIWVPSLFPTQIMMESVIATVNILLWIAILLVGTLVWRFADNLAGLITRGMEDAKSTPAKVVIDINLQAVAFGVIGVFIIVSAIASIVSIASAKLVVSSLFPGSVMFADDARKAVQVIHETFKIVIGLWLILSGFKLSGWLQSFRDYGLDLSEENSAHGDEPA